MFIDTMNSAELLQEYHADLPEIQHKTELYIETDYVSNYLRKRKKQQRVVITKKQKSSRGNDYLGVIIFQQGYLGKSKHWGWTSYHVGYMNTQRGLLALAFFANYDVAVKYTQHFFQRYKERLLDSDCDWKLRNQLQCAKTYDQLVSIYLQRNLGSSWIETQSVYKNKTHIFAPVPDGVALMQWDNQHETMQANTFIIYDILDEKQMSMINKLIEFSKLKPEDKERSEGFLFKNNNN